MFSCPSSKDFLKCLAMLSTTSLRGDGALVGQDSVSQPTRVQTRPSLDSNVNIRDRHSLQKKSLTHFTCGKNLLPCHAQFVIVDGENSPCQNLSLGINVVAIVSCQNGTISAPNLYVPFFLDPMGITLFLSQCLIKHL